MSIPLAYRVQALALEKDKIDIAKTLQRCMSVFPMKGVQKTSDVFLKGLSPYNRIGVNLDRAQSQIHTIVVRFHAIVRFQVDVGFCF